MKIRLSVERPNLEDITKFFEESNKFIIKCISGVYAIKEENILDSPPEIIKQQKKLNERGILHAFYNHLSFEGDYIWEYTPDSMNSIKGKSVFRKKRWFEKEPSISSTSKIILPDNQEGINKILKGDEKILIHLDGVENVLTWKGDTLVHLKREGKKIYVSQGYEFVNKPGSINIRLKESYNPQFSKI